MSEEPESFRAAAALQSEQPPPCPPHHHHHPLEITAHAFKSSRNHPAQIPLGSDNRTYIAKACGAQGPGQQAAGGVGVEGGGGRRSAHGKWAVQ